MSIFALLCSAKKTPINPLGTFEVCVRGFFPHILVYIIEKLARVTSFLVHLDKVFSSFSNMFKGVLYYYYVVVVVVVVVHIDR